MTTQLASTHISMAVIATLVAVLCGACASGHQRPAAEPMAASAPREAGAAPDSATRAEIARLWDEIDTWRSQSGMDGGDQAGELSPSGAETAATRAPEAEHVTSDLDPASVAAELEGPDATCPAEAADSPLCHDTCTLATSICDNAGSICRLAGELENDAWAAGKCADAAATCRDATARCCGCRNRG